MRDDTTTSCLDLKKRPSRSRNLNGGDLWGMGKGLPSSLREDRSLNRYQEKESNYHMGERGAMARAREKRPSSGREGETNIEPILGNDSCPQASSKRERRFLRRGRRESSWGRGEDGVGSPKGGWERSRRGEKEVFR